MDTNIDKQFVHIILGIVLLINKKLKRGTNHSRSMIASVLNNGLQNFANPQMIHHIKNLGTNMLASY